MNRAPVGRAVRLRRLLRAAAVAAAMAVASSAGLAGPAGAAVAGCDQAGAEVEAALQLPAGLLRAIGRVESGRRDPASGAFAPWPFTINAQGQGQFFEDAASAVAAVRGLLAGGTASIDVGCFQVNLMHHPLAFRRLEDGFDPAANAAYAGAFLRALRQRLGSWEAAVAAYHSATAERGEAYRARVFATWGGAPPGGTGAGGTGAGGTGAGAAPARRVGPVVIRIAGPDLSGPDAPLRVWTPSRPGTAASRIEMPAPGPAVAGVAAGVAAGGLPVAAMVPAARMAAAHREAAHGETERGEAARTVEPR